MDPQAIAEAVYETMEPNDRVYVGLGMRKVAIAPGQAVLEMEVREDMLNGHDICHGSMVFALADTAFALAANSHNYNAVLASAGIDLMASAHLGETLRAEASELWRRKRTALYDITVTGQDSRLIAVCRGRAHRVAGQPAPQLPEAG
jgi:acyl-CoA thioesterase